MKKYFAKLIAVNEPIVEGDLIRMDGSDVPIRAGGDNFNSGGYTKYKLFLCLNEINEGDLVCYRSRGHILTAVKAEPETNTLWVKMEIDNHDEKSLFRKIDLKSYPVTLSGYHPFDPKVIGLISEQAGWVREGDEFSEEEVGVLYNFIGEDSEDSMCKLNEWPDVVKSIYKDRRPKYIQNMINCPTIAIKGQCGHFH